MIFISIFSAKAHAQKKNILPFNELGTSVNHTTFINPNIKNKTGFGIGIYRQSHNDRLLKAKFGLEYNRTTIFKKQGDFGHFYHTTDITHNLNTFSLPVLINFSIGREKIFFIESGFYSEITFKEKITGTLHTYLPNKPYTKTNFTKKEAGLFDYGISVGFGFKPKISKHEIIIKPEYKYGLGFLSENFVPFSQRYLRIMTTVNI